MSIWVVAAIAIGGYHLVEYAKIKHGTGKVTDKTGNKSFLVPESDLPDHLGLGHKETEDLLKLVPDAAVVLNGKNYYDVHSIRYELKRKG